MEKIHFQRTKTFELEQQTTVPLEVKLRALSKD